LLRVAAVVAVNILEVVEQVVFLLALGLLLLQDRITQLPLGMAGQVQPQLT
jgi:hypothetical protein